MVTLNETLGVESLMVAADNINSVAWKIQN